MDNVHSFIEPSYLKIYCMLIGSSCSYGSISKFTTKFQLTGKSHLICKFYYNQTLITQQTQPFKCFLVKVLHFFQVKAVERQCPWTSSILQNKNLGVDIEEGLNPRQIIYEEINMKEHFSKWAGNSKPLILASKYHN